MQSNDSRLTFRHNFTEPVRLANTSQFYDPVKTDRLLTRILIEKEEPRADSRDTPPARL